MINKYGVDINIGDVDNPFIKLNEECGKTLFENTEFENKIKKVYKND